MAPVLLGLIIGTVGGSFPPGQAAKTRYRSEPKRPVIKQLTPGKVAAGNGDLQLEIDGTGFVSADVVAWNTTTLRPSAISSTTIRVAVPGALTAAQGKASVVVMAPNGQKSVPASFEILLPAPSISSVVPNPINATSNNVDVTINGSNFDSSSKVTWNGVDIPTRCLNAREIVASVPGGLLYVPMTAPVQVTTSAGKSSQINIIIQPSSVFTVQLHDNGFGSVKTPCIEINAQGVPASAVAQAVFDQLKCRGISIYYGEQISSKPITFQDLVPLGTVESADYSPLLGKMRAVLGVVVATGEESKQNRWFVSTDGSSPQSGSAPSSPSGNSANPAAPGNGGASPGGAQAASQTGQSGSTGSAQTTQPGFQNAGAPGSGNLGGSPPPAASSAAEYIRIQKSKDGYTLMAANTSAIRLLDALNFLGAPISSVDSLLQTHIGPRYFLAGTPYSNAALNMDYPAFGHSVEDLKDQLATTILGAASSSSAVTSWPMTFIRSDAPSPSVALGSGVSSPSSPAPSTPPASPSGNQGAVSAPPTAPGPGSQSPGSGNQLSGNAGGSAGASSPFQTSDSYMQAVASALAAADPMGRLRVQPLGTRLILTGPQSSVEEARRLLAQWIDVPNALVQVDFYVFNGVSHPGKDRTSAVNGIEIMHQGAQLCQAFQRLLTYAVFHQIQGVPEDEFGWNDVCDKVSGIENVRQMMKLAGFDPNPNRPLTLGEATVFLSFMKPCRRHAVFADAITEAKTRFTELVRTWLPACSSQDENTGRNKQLASKASSETVSSFEAARVNALRSLCKSWCAKLGPESFEATLATFDEDGHNWSDVQRRTNLLLSENFLKYWLIALEYDELKAGYSEGRSPTYWGSHVTDLICAPRGINPVFTHSELEDLLYNEDIPASLTRASAAADAGMKNAVAAFSGDITAICIGPYIAWSKDLAKDAESNDVNGLQLAGYSRVIVSAGQVSMLTTSEQANLPSRGSTDLNTILTGANTLATTIGGVTGAGDHLRVGSALLIALGLAQPGTIYNAVSPSVSIGVRPEVLKDGGSARLQLFLNIAAQTTPSAGQANPIPLDLTKSQTLTTDVNVDALDLFELTSSNLQVAGPGDYTWRVGPLADVPAIGNLFHGPTKIEALSYDTLILGRVTILPRTLDLAGTFLK